MAGSGSESRGVIDGVVATTGEPRGPTVIDLPPNAIRVTAFTALTSRDLSAVYFLLQGDRIVYVGRTKQLRGRLLTHCEAKDFDDAYILRVKPKMLAATERRWVRRLMPPLNVVKYKPPKSTFGKRGRPPKSAEDKRSAVLYLKLTPAERAEIDKAAGGEPSVWARGVLLRAAKR